MTVTLLFVVLSLVLYLVGLLLIELFGSAELSARLKARWESRLKAKLGGVPLYQPVDDSVDRLAALHTSFSRPGVIEEVLGGFVQGERHARLSAEEAIRQWLARRDFRASVQVLANRWRSTAAAAPREPRLIDDPVHGCVALDETLATVLAHPIVQRLNRIRQLSFSYAQFPSSSHTRLSHCLGVARNVELALSGILDRGVYYVVGERSSRPLPKEVLADRNRTVQKAKLVALLHDLGHGPFGHALDNYIGFSRPTKSNPDPDKVYTARYVRDYLSPTLASMGFDPQNLVEMLDPAERYRLKGTDAVIGDLIDSPLDVDRMDYLIRDAQMTGLSMGFANVEALLESLRLVAVDDAWTLAFDEAALGYMEHFLYAREGMYRNCYEHPRKRAAERIFERLIREVMNDTSLRASEEDLYALTDEEILCALRLCGPNSAHGSRLLDELLGDLDYVVVRAVEFTQPDSPAAEWRAAIAKGRAGDLKLRYIDQPANWEESIAVDSVGLERVAQIQVVLPAPSAYVQKFNAVRILTRGGAGFAAEEFLEVAKQTEEALKAMRSPRTRIKVMCPASFAEAEKESVRQAAIRVLEGR